MSYTVQSMCCLVLLCVGCRNGAVDGLVESTMTHTASVTTDQEGRSGVYHEVKQGQTLWSIARTYRVDVTSLMRANQLSTTSALLVGQRLYVPGATQQREVARSCPCGPDTARSLHSAPSPSPFFARRSSEQPVIATTLGTRTVTTRDVAETGLGQGRGFIRPVAGPISRHFEQSSGRRHDGIDIPAPRHTPIQAAADGEVIFSGWGPGGYGRVVILQHADDFVTLYAHNTENLVSVGQMVRQGEPIATVGRTGRATGDHLHFEIRYRTTPVSPYKFLPAYTDNVALLQQQ